jgi:hypothetical protein
VKQRHSVQNGITDRYYYLDARVILPRKLYECFEVDCLQ